MNEPCLSRGILVTDSVRGVNEDTGLIRSRMAWVLDGATGVTDSEHTPGRTDGEWYVEQLSAELTKRVQRSRASLSDIVRESVKAVAATYREVIDRSSVDPAAEPSATGAFVRWNERELEYLVLCDSTFLLCRGDELVERVTDDRIEPLETDVRNRIRSELDAGATLKEARAAVMPLLRENRRRKNTSGNYWVLSLDPNAVAHAYTGTVDLRPGDQAYLFTDGVHRLVDTYGYFDDWNEGVSYLRENSPQELLSELRSIELDDPNAEDHLRTKWADDATLVRLEFESPPSSE